MKYMIKLKYQYFLLPFFFAIIGFISIFNFIKSNNIKHAIRNFIIILLISLFVDMILVEIINFNFKLDLHNLHTISGNVYTLIRDVIFGGFFIWDQKKNIDFNKLMKKEV